MKLASMDVMLRPADDADAFARARMLGLDGVEFNLKIAQLRDPAGDRAKKLRELSASTGLAVPSMVLGEHNAGGLACWWRDQSADEEVRLAIDCCAAAGAETLLLPFFFSNEPKGRTHRAAVGERLKPLCDYAATKGVVIAFEGVLTADQLLEMAQQVNSPAFGVYFDPGNATWCDYDVPAELRKLGRLVRQMHIKDAKAFTGDAPAGEGRVDWSGVAAALDEIGFDRWLVFETSPASLERDVAFVRRTFRRLNGAAGA